MPFRQDLTAIGRLAAFMIKRARLAFLAIVIVLVYGLGVAYPALPRQSYPDIEQPQGFVTVPYPGATPTEVENLIVKKLEDKIQNISELEELSSSSYEGLAVVAATFEAGSNITDVLQKLREKVDEAKIEFPSDAKDPSINSLNFGDQPIIEIAIAGNPQRTPTELKDFAELISNRLEKIKGVSEVNLIGERKPELRVRLDPLRIAGYGISVEQVVGAIRTANLNLPGGELTIGTDKYLVRVISELTDTEQIANLAIPIGNKRIFIRDIATVSSDYEEATTLTRAMKRQTDNTLTGGPAVLLQIKKKLNTNIIQISHDALDILDVMKNKELPKDIQLIVTQNFAEDTENDLTNMQSSAMWGLGLVMLVLFLFINLRAALIASLAIPLSLGMAFILMTITGSTINFVSLFALVIAIGILVDNAIVIVENTHRHLNLGESPKDAAIISVSEVGVPVISATLTTLAAFLPLALMTGVMGKFVQILPLTIMFCLTSSLIVALLFTPVLSAYFAATRKSATTSNRFWDILSAPIRSFRTGLDNLAKRYKPFARWLMHSAQRKLIVVTLAWSLFALSIYLPLSGILPTSFFPKEDVGMLVINIELPQGTSLAGTSRLIAPVEEIANQIPELTAYSTTVGKLFTDIGAQSSGDHLANLLLKFPKSDERERTTFTIAAELRTKLALLPGMQLTVWEPAGGPPASNPINIRVLGDDLATLRSLARQLGGILKHTPGAISVNDGTSSGTQELVITVDRQRATILGLSVSDISKQIRTVFAGTTAVTLYSGETDVDIVVRASTHYRDQLTDLTQLNITTGSSVQIPFESVAEITLRPGPDTIHRFDSTRVITVKSDIPEGELSSVVLKRFRATLAEAEAAGDFTLPKGYTITYAGENEDTSDSFTSLGDALLIGFILIYLILATQFNSLTQPFSILTAMPLGLIGVFPGLWLLGINFTFTSFIGVVALLGIVVNDAIVLFDFIATQNVKKKLPLSEAIAEAGSIRLAPILSTSLTTIGGLLPLTLSQPTWGPLGYAMIFGLSLSTVLTLVVIPAMFALTARYNIFAFLVIFLGLGLGGGIAFLTVMATGFIFLGIILGITFALTYAYFIAPHFLNGAAWLLTRYVKQPVD